MQAARRFASIEIDERRQESGERLAGARRRDEQNIFARSRAFDESELMRARRPATHLKPSSEAGREKSVAVCRIKLHDIDQGALLTSNLLGGAHPFSLWEKVAGHRARSARPS